MASVPDIVVESRGEILAPMGFVLTGFTTAIVGASFIRSYNSTSAAWTSGLR